MSPSRLIGTIVYFFVLLGALSVAISYTGNPGLTSLLEGVYGYLPKVVPVIVMSIAVFMILEQLEIAPEIVRILSTALIGALALGPALAFGLGGRNVAERLLEQAYDKGQEKRDEVRRDYELGKERGQRDYEQAKGRAQQEHEARSGGGAQQAPPPGSGRPAGEPGRGHQQRGVQRR